MDDKDFYYDASKFEVEMIASRSNFLLVFQSMLFTAVTSIADKNTFIPIWLILALGFITSVVWAYLNWLTYVVNEHVFDKLIKIDTRMKEIMTARESHSLLKKGSV